jgi:hypothetical protein
MFAIQTVGALAFSDWELWAIILTAVFVSYLVGFKLGYGRGRAN